MSYKNAQNPAVAFLKSAGIRKQDNLQLLLTKEYGSEAAGKLKSALDAIEMKRDRNSTDRTEFYDFIHSQKQFSHIYTCFESGSYLSEICRWLNTNRERLGKTILDVGCGSGVITCFLAQMLPESTFLAVDRSTNALAMARKLRDSLELTNVVFMQADVSVVKGRTFDTVLALRTLSENQLFKEDPFVPFGKDLEAFCRSSRPYMEVLGKLVSPGGNLFLAEPVFGQLASLGLQNELNHLLLGADPKDQAQISCRIGDDKDLTRFQLFIGTQGTVIPNDRILDSWEKDAIFRGTDKTYVDTGARYMCWELAESVIEEYRMHRPDTKLQAGLFALYTIKGNPDLFLLYQVDEQNASLAFFPMSRKEEASAFLSGQCDMYRSQGYLVVS